MPTYKKCCSDSRFKIRSADNREWLDVCDYPMYIRNEDNTGWLRILPDKAVIRHGSNDCWLDITCNQEIDDVSGCMKKEREAKEEIAKQSGNEGATGSQANNPNAIPDPNNPAAIAAAGGSSSDLGVDATVGSGGSSALAGTYATGLPSGSWGAPMVTYSAGNLSYGVPAVIPGSGGIGSGSGTSFGSALPYGAGYGWGPSGYVYGPSGAVAGIVTSDGSTLPYTAGGCGTVLGNGLSNNPAQCGETRWDCGGATVTEVLYAVGTEPGNVQLAFNVLNGAAAFEIMYGPDYLRTDGLTAGTGTLNFMYNYNPALGVGDVIMVRVTTDGNPNTSWQITLYCPDVMGPGSEPYGSPVEPAPCNSTIDPEQWGGQGLTEITHDMGSVAGTVYIDYQMWNQPDRLDVFHNGSMVATTGDFVSGTGTLSFPYDPTDSQIITVRVNARDPGTSWGYRLGCPGDNGGVTNPKPCSDIVESTGAGVSDIYIDMGAVPGVVVFEYNMWDVPDSIDVYQGNTLIATSNGPISGINTLSFAYDPANGNIIKVRIIGDPGSSTWALRPHCPVADFPVISVQDTQIVEGSDDPNNVIMQFNVCLDHTFPLPVTADYYTTDGTAKSLAVTPQILAYDANSSLPYILITDDIGPNGEKRRIVLDGGFPKYYNRNFSGSGFTSFNGSFQFLYNVINWIANQSKVSQGNKNILILGDANSGEHYNVIDTGDTNFGVSIPSVVRIAGFNPVIKTANDVGGSNMNIPYSELDKYCCCLFFSTATVSPARVSESLASNIARFVMGGNGLFVVTDHNVFQNGGNVIVQKFGARFFGNVDRSPVSVSTLINLYGNHPLWDSVTGTLGGGVSEGNVEILQITPDYVPAYGTVTIPPGNLCSTVNVEIIGDIDPEDDETFKFNIDNPVNASTDPADVTQWESNALIIDDDYPTQDCGGGSSLTSSSSTTVSVNLGSTPGLVEMLYATVTGGGTAANTLNIFAGQTLLASTGGPVIVPDTSPEYLRFIFDPSTMGSSVSVQNIGQTFWMFNMPCPVPKKYLNGYIFDTTAEVDNVKATYVPPSPQDIFNTWPRSSGSNYFTSGTSATGEASAWQLVNDNVLMPNNTGLINTILSPSVYDTYDLEATVTSSNYDDDNLGLVIAFQRNPGNATNYALVLAVGKGGLGVPKGFGILLYENNSYTVKENVVVSGGSSGWNGDSMRIRIERRGDIITVYGSAWGSSSIDTGLSITIDLNSDTSYTTFKHAKQYGYYTHSQAYSTYNDIVFSENEHLDIIYDWETKTPWKYDYTTNTWNIYNINGSPASVQEIYGYYTEITNPITELKWDSVLDTVTRLTTPLAIPQNVLNDIDITSVFPNATNTIPEIGLQNGASSSFYRFVNSFIISSADIDPNGNSLVVYTDDTAEVFINAVSIGTTPSLTVTSLPIPSGLLVIGRNNINIKVYNAWGPVSANAAIISNTTGDIRYVSSVGSITPETWDDGWEYTLI